MRYWTRWVHVKYEINKRQERLIRKIVWWLPRRIAYWAAIRVMAAATTGEYSNQVVPELTAMDALKRWDPA
jgi:hypothetical protein